MVLNNDDQHDDQNEMVGVTQSFKKSVHCLPLLLFFIFSHVKTFC